MPARSSPTPGRAFLADPLPDVPFAALVQELAPSLFASPDETPLDNEDTLAPSAAEERRRCTWSLAPREREDRPSTD